jgi:hypothetical protein
MTGIPTIDQLFNGTICMTATGSFGQLFSDISTMDVKEATIDTTTPVVIERCIFHAFM